MGNKQSSNSKNVNTTDILNKNTVKSFNDSLFKTGIETLIKTANQCSSAVAQDNNCDFRNFNAAGDVTIGGNQSNKASVNFSCINSSTTKTSMATEMLAKASAELKAASATGLEAQLASSAAAQTTTGAGATAIGNSSASNSDNINKTKIRNINSTEVINKLEQVLNSSFTSDTVNECIGKTTQTNSLSAKDIKSGGNITADCIQTNTLEQVQECKALADVINTVSQKVIQETGIAVAVSNETKQSVSAASSSTNTAVSTGPIQDLFNGIAGVFGAATGGGMYSVLCVCSVVMGGMVFMMTQQKGGEGGGMPSMSDMKAKFASSKGGGKKNNKIDDIITNSAVDLITSLLSTDNEYL
jgi:hypothetical protein